MFNTKKNDEENDEENAFISNNLHMMTKESLENIDKLENLGQYKSFTNLAMQTLFFILRRLVLEEEKKDDYSVKLGGRGFNGLGTETADFLQKKSSLFNKSNNKDIHNLKNICEVFDDYNIVEIIARNNHISSASSYSMINLQKLHSSINSIADGENNKLDIFTKTITRNLILSSMTLLSLLYKLIEERIFNTHDEYANDYLETRKAEIIELYKIQDISDLAKKLFFLDKKTGKLLNPSDGSRNVSFKVETFNTILNVVNNKNILFDAGYQPGVKFGNTFNDILIKENIFTPIEIIKKWFEFDSDVGFGSFHLEGFDGRSFLMSSLDSQKNNIVGYIYIEYNFLKESKYYSDIKLFLAGYVQGVLDGIFIKNNIFSEDAKSFNTNTYFEVKETSEDGKNSKYEVSIKNLKYEDSTYIILRNEDLIKGNENEKN